MEIRRGVLRAFDAGTYKASVESRRVAVLFFEPSNPDDAVICAVWT